jgi:hypothetical protein
MATLKKFLTINFRLRIAVSLCGARLLKLVLFVDTLFDLREITTDTAKIAARQR